MKEGNAKWPSKEYFREHKRKQRLREDFKELEYERNKVWREANNKTTSIKKKEYYLLNKEQIKKDKCSHYLERKLRMMKWEVELTNFVKTEAKDLVKKRNTQTGSRWSIDHEIPLKGKIVSGLDVWNNLKVIPLLENNRKYNNYAVST